MPPRCDTDDVSASALLEAPRSQTSASASSSRYAVVLVICPIESIIISIGFNDRAMQHVPFHSDVNLRVIRPLKVGRGGSAPQS